MTGMLCRLQRYHLVDIVDDVLAHTEHSNTVGHRSGIAVDDSTLFENTTLPAIDMELSSDPDIVNVWRKSYSLEDITSVVDESDSDSSDAVSNSVKLLLVKCKYSSCSLLVCSRDVDVKPGLGLEDKLLLCPR